MKRTRLNRALSTALALAMTLSLLATPGVTAAASVERTSTPPMNIGRFPIELEKATYWNDGKEVTYDRSIRDPNIRPDAQIKLTSDNDYLVRSFQKSLDYTYNELVVGPRQFPLNDNDERVTKHFAGVGPYTSTAVPSIWGTYHGFPGGSYRECFCDRDVSHTAEACSILALNEENYAMLERFAEESVEMYWRATSHGWVKNGSDYVYDENAVWEGTPKKDAMKWFPLWSQDFYGDAYYMDASFRELPAPFEVLDKVWTQYRWTGDERWISDAMLNYGYHINAIEDGLMDWYDYDGDGMVDNVRDYGWAPTLYEYEDASEMQLGQATVVSKDEASGDANFPYKSVITLEPDFFRKHDFYQLPLDAKIIGVDEPSGIGNVGEQVFILNNLDKKVTDLANPAVLRDYDRLSSRRDDIRDVVIPLYTPEGVSFEIYEGRHKLTKGTHYTVDMTKANYPVVTLKKEFFGNTGYPAGVTGADGYLEKKINLGIVTRFYQSESHTEENDIARGTTELYLNTGDIISEKDRMQLKGLSMKVGDVTTDLTDRIAARDEKTGVINLDYHSDTPTSYTLTIHHRTPITPRMFENGRPKDLKDYFKGTSDLVRVLAAGDTVGCQYQALLGMANMIRARIALGNTKLEIYHYEKTEKVVDKTIILTEPLAQEYEDRAHAIQRQVWKEWVNPTWGYARAVNRLGELDTGWGHENSFFMPMKELLAPGEPTQKYLNFIQMNALLGTALNEEALTYMPETFYMSGQNVSGWQWSKVSMNRLDEQQRNPNQIMSTYPEIAMINIYNTINLLMGVEPQASDTAVSTLPRLTPEVGWVQAENIPLNQTGRASLGTEMPDGKGGTYYGLDSAGKPRDVGFGKPRVGSLYTVRQDGTHTTTFTNQGADGQGNGGDTIQWCAQFYSVNNQSVDEMNGYEKLYVSRDGGVTFDEAAPTGHTTKPPYTTYLDLVVAPGDTVIVSTRPDPARPAANTRGELYLSDFEWTFADYPTTVRDGITIGEPKRDMSYAGTTLYESSFLTSYAKGIGTKVADNQGTTVRYLIPGNATEFTAKAILTDFPRTSHFEVEKGETTAVRNFEVYVDGVKQGETVTVGAGGNLSPKDVNITFNFNDSRLHTLDLVTSKNAASGSEGDVGAAWADAKIAIVGTSELPDDLPETGMYLSNLSPETTAGKVTIDVAAEENKPIMMGGLVFQKGVSMSGKSSATFDLGGVYESLTLTMGKQDGKSRNGELQIWLDDSQAYNLTTDGPVPHTVDLKIGSSPDVYAEKIKLVYTGDSGCVNFADGILELIKGTDLTDPAIIAKRVLSAPDAALGQTMYTMPELPVKEPGKYTMEVASCEPADVIAANGSITPGDNGQDVTVSFLIKENGSERTGTTKSFTVYVPGADTLPLDRMKWEFASSNVRLNADSNGQKLKVDGETYDIGVGMRNTDSVTYALSDPGVYGRFTGTVGYAQNSGNNADDLFRVKFEGVRLDSDSKEIARDLLHSTPVLGKGDQGDNKHLETCAACQTDILNFGYANSDQVDFDLDGYDKLVVSMVKVGDSSYGYCALVACDFHKTSPYTGKTVSALAEISINTVAKTKPALPAQVTATYADMAQEQATRKLPVTWDAIDPGKYDTVGKTFDVEGTVRGTTLKATCHVTVVDKIPLTAEKSSVRAEVYTAPQMPATVKVKYSDKSEGHVAVTWENVPVSGYTRPGTVIIYGAIASSALKPICAVDVYDPNAIKVAGMITLDNIVAGNGREIGEFKLLGNGVSYPNSIFAHADSTVTIPLTGGDKEYTRFITDVGSKAGGAANFISAGYGVKNGVETLLFKTDMVTSVRGPNSSGDSKGYAYIDGNTVYTVDVSVAGYDALKLTADVANDANSDHCVYGTPMLYTADSRVGQNLHTITVPANAGGAIWPNGKVAVQDGEDLVFTIKPNPAGISNAPQMGLEALLLDGTALSTRALKNPDGTYTYTMKHITADHNLTATFRENILDVLVPNLAAGNGKITIAAQKPISGAEFYYKHTTGTDVANKPQMDADFVSDGWTALTENTVVPVANGSTYFFQVVKVSDGMVKGWGEKSATPDENLFQVSVSNGYLGDNKDTILMSAHTNDQIKVTAKVPGGKRFTTWNATGLTLGENENKDTFTFAMPNSDVLLTAGYENITSINLVDMDSLSITAPNGSRKDSAETFADGTTYKHSLHAHAPSETLVNLDGGYTRFITKVGTSGNNGSNGGGDSTSFIAEAYGIDAQGKETLLYKTDMVTKLGAQGSASINNGADEKGYYYITNRVDAMRNIDVDVTGYQRLRLVMDEIAGANSDHSSYATPILYTAADAAKGTGFHTVTVTSGNNGGVWPNGKVAVDNAGTLTLTIKPNPDNTANVAAATLCYLTDVIVDGEKQAVKPNGDGTYTLTLANVMENHTVDVSFAAEKPALAPTLTEGNGKLWLAAMESDPGATYYYKYDTQAGTELTIDSAFAADGWTAFDAKVIIGSLANGTEYFVQVAKVVEVGGTKYVKAWGQASATPNENAAESVTVNMSGITMGTTYTGSPVVRTGVATGTYGDSQTYTGAFTYIYTGRNGMTYESTETAPTDAGDYTLTAAVSGTTDYQGEDTLDFTIAKAPSHIDTIQPITATYGDTIKVEFTPAAGSVAKTIAAPALNEAALFLGATQLTDPVTADGSGKFTLTYNTTGKGIPAGANTLTVKYGGSGNLNEGTATVTVTLNAKSVTITSLTATRVFDKTKTLTADTFSGGTVDGKLPADTVNVTKGTGTVSDANVGIGKTVTCTGFTLNGADESFYRLSVQPTATATITKATHSTPVTMNVDIVKHMTNAQSGELTVENFVTGVDWVGAAISGIGVGDQSVMASVALTDGKIVYTSKTSVTATAAETYAVTISSTNYENVSATLTFTPTDKLAVTISGVNVADKTYDGKPVSYTGTPVVKLDGNIVPEVEVAYQWKSAAGAVLPGAPKDAGSYKLVVSVVESDTTYTGSTEIPFTISKADSAVDPTPGTKTVTYGGTLTVEFTPSVSPKALELAGVELNQAALFRGATQLTEAVEADANGKFTLTYDTSEKGIPVGADQTLTVKYGGGDNLNAGSGDVKVTLTAKTVTITGVTATRAFDKTTALAATDFSDGSVTGLVGADDVTPKYGTGDMGDANVGKNKSVTCIGFSLEGANASFYTLSAQPTDTVAEITQAVYSGSKLARNVFIVKGMETAQTGTLDAAKFVIGHDWVNALITDVTDDANDVMESVTEAGGIITYISNTNLDIDTVATYTVTISSLNYEDVEATLTFTPTVKKVVTIEGITLADKTYDGSAIAYTGVPVAKLDDESVDISDFTFQWLTAGGAELIDAPTDAGDYELVISVDEGNETYTGSETYPVTIERKAVTVSLRDVSIYLGDTLPQTFSLNFDGLVSGENLDVELTAAFSGMPENSSRTGSYEITWTNVTEIKSAIEALDVAKNYTVTCEPSCTLTIADRPAPPSSNTETEKKVNEDGSTTTTVTNKRTGTVTATTKWPDGKVQIVETKKDGTVTESVSTPDGTKTEAIKNPDGSRTTTEIRKDGTKVESATDSEGDTTAAVTVPKGTDGVTVTIPTLSKPKPGEVVVITKEDGSQEIIKTAVATEDGMRLVLTEDANLAIIDNSKDFIDVAGKDWFYDAVQFTAARELFTGTGKDAFTPGGSTTRATLFTVLARLDGQDTAGGGNWYEKGMAWAKDSGISDGTNPEGNISREQLAAMLYRYAGSPDTVGMVLGEFTDSDSVSAWASDAIRWAVETGILQGSNGALNPGGSATRGEVAIMLQRFVENVK